MVSDDTSLQALKEEVAAFARERSWERFHSPKNLAMALAVEAAELMELFQWMTEDEAQKAKGNPEIHQATREELADIAIYILNFCTVMNIDLGMAVRDKLAKNASKYPRGMVRRNP